MLFSTALLASLLVAVSAKKGLLAAYFPGQVLVTAPVTNEVNATMDWNVIDIGYYFVAVTSKDGLVFPSDEKLKGIEDFVSGAQKNEKKAVLSVGGYDGSKYFSSLVRTDAARANFLKQIREIIEKYGFNGVDIDWEFPVVHGDLKNEVDPSDSANLLKLLQDLRHSGRNDWISMAVSVNGIFGPSGTRTLTDYKPFADVVDAFNVMAYDYVGGWSDQTGPDSPSQKCGTGRSYISDIEGYTKAGFPANKIILGVPSFAKAFVLRDSTLSTSTVYGDQKPPQKYSTRIFQKYDTYTGAAYTYVKMKAEGILVSEDGIQTGKGYARHYDHCSKTPFVFNSHTKSFITYLDARSAAYRAQRSVEEKYLGVSVFSSTGFDDYGKYRGQLSTWNQRGANIQLMVRPTVFNAIDKALKTPIGGFPSP